MSTTIDALRNLGLKVNGEEPQSNYVNNVINEIADNYSPSEAGMSNPMTTAGDIIVGGTSGAPTRLAKGTQGQVLSIGSSGLEWANASSGGGTQLYKHVLYMTPTIESETEQMHIEVISNISTAVPTTTVSASYNALLNLYDNAVQMRIILSPSGDNDGNHVPVLYADLGSSNDGVDWHFTFYHPSAESVVPFSFTTPLVSDTVTAL